MSINISRLSGVTRSQKILLSLYKSANGTSKQVRFEDIVVEAFNSFKSDFQLRGYPQYPESGDIIHKPLYSELKKLGYVTSGNKYFSLTPKGIEYAKKLLNMQSGNVKSQGSGIKLAASQQKELERIMQTTAFQMFSEGKKDDILDIDFYSFLGVTVRTNKFDFLGRYSTVEDAITASQQRSDTVYKLLHDCFEFLKEKFRENIEYIKNEKGGKR